MSTSSNVSLGSLRLQSQQRSDMENNEAISTSEWNGYLSQSYKELFDLLVAAYGNDYHVATTYQFQVGSTSFVALPDGTPSFTNSSGGQAQKFYKLLGVDLQYSASPNGWVTLRRFEFIERNKYAYPNTAVNWSGYTNLRYRLEGNNLYFIPLPMTGQTARIWYIPAPTSLQFTLPCTTTLNATLVGLTDTTGLATGMNVYGSGIPDNTILSSVGSTSVIVSNSVSATQSSAILSFWSDSTTLDGISGWEEYIVIDAAIKAQIKQENDWQGLAAQKLAMSARIESMAVGRDAGQAQHVSDALGANSWSGYGGDDGGWGMGGNY